MSMEGFFPLPDAALVGWALAGICFWRGLPEAANDG